MKKLLTILGAGSSVEQGMPSVSDLDRHILSFCTSLAHEHQTPDYFSLHWKNRKQYSHGHPLIPYPTFELVLGDMTRTIRWAKPAPYGDAIRMLAGELSPLLLPASSSDPFALATDVSRCISHIMAELARFMRATCMATSHQTTAANTYASILSRLRQSFDIGAYNLNYDNCAITAAPDLFHGFAADGVFCPRSVHDRDAWSFLYHLHGSVHHTLVGTFGESTQWRSHLDGRHNDGHAGTSPEEYSDGLCMPRTSLVAGGIKLDQLLREPYHSFYSSLTRHSYAADAILIAGYGFNDEHVNRCITNRLQHAARPRIAVIDYSDDHADCIEFAGTERNLMLHTLRCGSHFRKPGHTAPSDVLDLKTTHSFEVNDDVAFWHGGYLSLLHRLDDLCAWLGGEAPASVLATTQ